MEAGSFCEWVVDSVCVLVGEFVVGCVCGWMGGWQYLWVGGWTWGHFGCSLHRCAASVSHVASPNFCLSLVQSSPLYSLRVESTCLIKAPSHTHRKHETIVPIFMAPPNCPPSSPSRTPLISARSDRIKGAELSSPPLSCPPSSKAVRPPAASQEGSPSSPSNPSPASRTGTTCSPLLSSTRTMTR